MVFCCKHIFFTLQYHKSKGTLLLPCGVQESGVPGFSKAESLLNGDKLYAISHAYASKKHGGLEKHDRQGRALYIRKTQ